MPVYTVYTNLRRNWMLIVSVQIRDILEQFVPVAMTMYACI